VFVEYGLSHVEGLIEACTQLCSGQWADVCAATHEYVLAEAALEFQGIAAAYAFKPVA